ncbi:ATPase/histidine kinase/DNA gyrase B/HSP90 domain containing protein [Acanthamoeba castellanii str. Neff]|uniref:histidine kinase n=1 Tax=Acanthamoeba castellanii (strain ATCC 30010 / Neff) TaxID=1257118 RepID=L8GLZ1_ACACF|nr:ATPase/histidine kinase/DNA gyrase B/HSP90 domain containing protein [Acanthamoeba castellanii str. Neff]ELR13748.1 ATPase/histidine kinase/DNA gyrase B/HSP90 domain containing protein [Acanthamoeba castellanii str. Neff]
MGLVDAASAYDHNPLGRTPLADSAQRSAPATAPRMRRKKNCYKPTTTAQGGEQDGKAATTRTALHPPDSTSGSCTLFVVILVSYLVLNLGLGVMFAAMPGSLWSTSISITNAVTAVILLIFLRLRFHTSFVLFLWTSHLYLFASRLTVCEPTLGVDKWCVLTAAFFIAGVQGGSVTLFIGTLLHMFLPLWGHLARDALYCTAFPAQSLPSLRMIGTFHFALYVGISCVGYELSRSSALRQMQRALAEKEATNAQLLQVSKAKERFIANTSHELRTPLHGIIAMTSELLEGEGLQQKRVRDAVVLILSCAQHLNTLITDMLSFQTLISAKPDLVYAAFSLTDEIERAWGQAVAAAYRKGVRMTSNVRLQHWRRWGNAQSVRQVLQCLLSNAVKFTPTGGQVELVARELNSSAAEPQEVSLGSDLADAASEMVEFRVIDTGIGIDPENRAHLFSGFTQLDDSLRREYGGNGLGLAIGQRLVEAMGGSIACSSEPNRGSTFTVVLPLPLAPSDDHPPTASSAQGIPQTGSGEGSPALGVAPLLPHDEEGREKDELVEEQRPRRGENKLRVLLVEDNMVNQKVGVRMLESLGCEVDVAVNGLEAVAAVERALGFFGGEGSEGHDDHTAAAATTGDNGHHYHYDLILMDCQMPGKTLHAHTTIALGPRADVVMDGFKATKRIRELERRRRIAEEVAERRKVVVRVPIVAVTASATQKYEDKAYACDMDDFVAKPLNRSTLKAALDKWTRRPAAAVQREDDRQKGGIEEATEPVHHSFNKCT